ncbi:MAG TPA: gamma-glutamyltransferase [Streptosporangiaceae bacterium]|nr:gamma-glutamyltransferase [Streptosporangiaceae bacterium]
MVASTHWLASAAGMAVLEAGGNAFDAAVATGLVLQVVEPHLNGPGGEVPIIGYSASEGSEFVVDGQGVAPAAATLAAFSDLGIDLVPGNGLLPAMVPGAFGAWMLLLQRYGTLPLREVMKYAIGYAGDGYPMLPGASAAVEAMTETFTLHWPTSAEIYLADGTPAPGFRFSNKVLADTYARVLAEAEAAGADRDAQIEAARRAWYEGFVAEAIEDFAAGADVMDVTGRPHRGLLRGSDIAAWRASVEEPVRFDFHGVTVCKTGPWGQGPVFCQQLALLDGLGVDDLRPGSSALIHTVTEAAKLAFADREAWYGDPRHSDVPLADLLSADYTSARRQLVTDQASAELVPGAPGGRQPALPAYATAGGSVAFAAKGTGEPTMGDATRGAATLGSVSLGPGDTCHLDIADRFGNLVSATPSGGWLQSSPAVPGLGFCLGTRGQMFALTPGFASTLAPGRRPRTTLSPSLVLREGEPYMAFGTPGGDQQDQWTVGFFLNHVVYGMNLQQAIDFPAYHTDHFPSSFYPRGSIPRSLSVESRAGEQVVGELRARGHDATVSPPWSLGRISAVSRDRGFLHAAANPRGMQGYAVGR